MKAEDHTVTLIELAGWKARVTSYRVGDQFHCVVDNVSPGAWIARATAATREEAEREATGQAEERLARTRIVEP